MMNTIQKNVVLILQYFINKHIVDLENVQGKNKYKKD
jgi:predicted double-glycine peptidase